METTKLPFNPELPSSIPKERINELNQLALSASLNDGDDIEKYGDNSLVQESCGMQEVYEGLSEMAMCTAFYPAIDEAFRLSLANASSVKDRDRIFETYQDLTSLFRTIEKQRRFIDRRWAEVNAILADMRALEEEAYAREKELETV